MLCTCSLSFQVGTSFREDSPTPSENSDIDADYALKTSAEPHFPTKQQLGDLIGDLGLTKSGAELLTYRLNEWNLLGDDCKSTAYRKRHLEFSVYFDVIEDLCYCKDVEGLFRAVEIDHDPTQWRFFIDSSTKSLKAVLLHNGNIYPSIPLSYSLQMKKDYENVKQLLIKINYAQFKWYVCGDFKLLGFCGVCRVDTQNTLAFCACEIVELMVSTTRKFIGRHGKN